jgi:mannose-6-phosphate isomerase-like protein (cupin superfamily)
MISKKDERPAQLREHMRGGEGTVTVNPWFKPEDFGAKVRLCAQMTLGPGCSIGTHQHNGEDEIYIVLAGEGEVEEAGQWKPVRQGDAILTGKGASHGLRNTGKGPLSIAAIIVLY